MTASGLATTWNVCLFNGYLGVIDFVTEFLLFCFTVAALLVCALGLAWLTNINPQVTQAVNLRLRRRPFGTFIFWCAFAYTAVLLFVPFHLLIVGPPGAIAALGELGCSEMSTFVRNRSVGSGFFMSVSVGTLPAFMYPPNLPLCDPLVVSGYHRRLIHEAARLEYDPESDDPAAIRALPPIEPPATPPLPPFAAPNPNSPEATLPSQPYVTSSHYNTAATTASSSSPSRAFASTHPALQSLSTSAVPMGACEWARRTAAMKAKANGGTKGGGRGDGSGVNSVSASGGYVDDIDARYASSHADVLLVRKEVRNAEYFGRGQIFHGILNYFFGLGQQLAHEFGLAMARDTRASPYIDPVLGKCGAVSVHSFLPFGVMDMHKHGKCGAIHPSLADENGACVRPPPPNIVLRVMLDCARGLADLHDLSAARWGASGTIVHSDIKTSQYRFSAPIHHGGRVILGDLNRARRTGVGGQCEPVAQGAMRSPEELKKATFTQQTDVYSLGWVLAGVLSNSLADGASLAPATVMEGHHPAIPHWAPRGTPAIIQRLWSMDPAKRGSARQAADEIEAIAATYPPVMYADADSAEL